jgi:hypothetical protein
LRAANLELFSTSVLRSLSRSTGLKVNFKKSCLILINLDEIKIAQLAQVFGCQIGSFPFTNLGFHMGTTKPKVDNFLPIMNKIERRLSTITTWLTMVGRLTVINSTLSTLPTYTMCTLKLLDALVKFIDDRARRDCLCRGNDITSQKKPTIALDKVTTPKANGGLGVVNLRM